MVAMQQCVSGHFREKPESNIMSIIINYLLLGVIK